ncbi:hypothetical protein CEUSTIGMA_g8631.t1, partial [Chlamydomonas eustigma]
EQLNLEPYRLTLVGTKHTGSDTAYEFQLVIVPVVIPPLVNGEVYSGDCADMYIRDMAVSIYDNLLVKYVLFNGSTVDWWASPNAVNSTWISIGLYKSLSEFDASLAYDFVITVRGNVSELCPATVFFQSQDACEYAMHGRSGEFQCCPHGITQPQGPPSECCVDQLSQSPYRLEYLDHVLSTQSTSYNFGIEVVTPNVSALVLDQCSTMSLDYLQIQIFSHINVLQVLLEDRVLPFNITPATNYSNWLNINDINKFLSDFNPMVPASLTVVLEGWINEPCPASWLFNHPAPLCEYVFHGEEGQVTCCPLGLTQKGQPPESCGCRDDLDQSPYRMAYSIETQADDTSTFEFSVAMIGVGQDLNQPDFDGYDTDFGVAVNCSAMTIKDIKIAIWSYVNVTSVTFNTAVLDYQFTYNNPQSNWLWILGVDYSVTDFELQVPLSLSVTIEGSYYELCPASDYFGSQSSCEYIVTGYQPTAPFYEGCCPHGVTAYGTPSRLQNLAGNSIPGWTYGR